MSRKNDRERPSVAIYETGVEVDLEDAPFHADRPPCTTAVGHIVEKQGMGVSSSPFLGRYAAASRCVTGSVTL